MEYKVLSKEDKSIVKGNIRDKEYDPIQSYECVCDCTCNCDCACFCFDSLHEEKGSLERDLLDISLN